MAARNTRHDARSYKPPAASPGRFGLLLIVLTGCYLLSAFAANRWTGALRVVLFAVAALLALRHSVVAPRTARLILTAVLTGSAIMLAVSLTTETGAGIAAIWVGVVLLFAVVLIVHRVLSFGTVTIQHIYGALSAYLITGLMFAAFFAALNSLGGDHLFANGQPTEVAVHASVLVKTLSRRHGLSQSLPSAILA
jgi:hypothetical protein